MTWWQFNRPMISRAALAFWAGLVVLLTGMTCRALWMASRTETGLQTLKQQWIDATVGSVLGSRVPIQSRDPDEQAKFWLGEVDRVLDGSPESAELAMGAALILDSPSPDFISKYVKRIGSLPGTGLIPQLDDEGIERAADAFEVKCKQRCLELATAATELDPTNAEWWRLRALLLWRFSIHSYDRSPRDSRWIEILKECAQHDPDNALYDDLAAYLYWESSAELDFSGDNDRLVIHDTEKFNLGIDYFRRGQTKIFLAVGDAGFSAVASFLDDAKIPLADHPHIVNSRSVHLRRSVLLRNVLRWQGLRAAEEAAAGNAQTALAMHRENLRLLEQLTTARPAYAYDIVPLRCRIVTTTQMNVLANKHRDVISADEMQEIRNLRELAEIDESVLQHAAMEFTAGKAQPTAGMTMTGSPSGVALAIAVSMLSSIAIVLFLLGFVSILVTCFMKSPSGAKIGLIGHTLTVLAAFSVTMTVFGLAPARIISQESQSWASTVLVILTMLVLLSGIAWVWLRRRAFRYSLRTLLISVFVLCILLTLVSINRSVAAWFTTLPFDLAIPARGWGDLDAKSLENALRPLGGWLWAVIQWAAYHGQYLTVAMWAGFVAVLLLIKGRIERRKVEINLPPFHKRIGAFFRSLGMPSITLSAFALVAYLVLAPTVVQSIENEFQNQMAFARRPDVHWTQVEKAIQKVRTDDLMMEDLKKAVRAELSEPSQGNEQ